jgi:hypothetical protein
VWGKNVHVGTGDQYPYRLSTEYRLQRIALGSVIERSALETEQSYVERCQKVSRSRKSDVESRFYRGLGEVESTNVGKGQCSIEEIREPEDVAGGRPRVLNGVPNRSK